MPKDGEPKYQSGLAYLALGDLAKAAANLRWAIELNPKDQRAQLKLGELMASSSSKDVVQRANIPLQEVLSASPNNPDAIDALALAEWKLGKTDEAVGRLEDTLRKFPSRLHTSVELARLKLGQKDMAGAEQLLKQAVAGDPKSSLAELALAQLYLVTNQPAKAEVELHNALRLDPKNGTALMGLAAIQMAGKRTAEAEETYRRLAALPIVEFKPLHAMFLYSQGKRDAALAEFEKLAKEDPDDRAARTRLFTAYVRMGKDRAAQNLVAAALKKNPKDTDMLLERAGLSLQSGNVGEAEKDILDVLRFKPDFAEAHTAMALVDNVKGLALSERHELSEALRPNPALLQARLALARNYVQANESKSALDLLNEVPANQRGALAVITERNWALLGTGETKELRSALDQALRAGRAPELVIQDGVLRLRQADYSGAIADAEEAIRNNDLRGARLLAGAYQAQKQPAKAEKRLKELLGAHPKSAPLANLLGLWYLETGNLSEARTAFESALSADPKFLDAGLSLAGIDTREKHLDAARQRLLWFVAAYPKNVAPLLMLGEVAGEMGDQEEALRRYRAALALDGSNVVALNNVAYTLASSQPDEALKYARQASELAPDNAMVHDTLGWVYYKKMIYGTAVTYLEKAVAEEPTPRRQFHLAVCYLKQGQRAVGEKTLQLALRQDPNLPASEKGW
jgi:Tfp pilus assembly protein PilF